MTIALGLMTQDDAIVLAADTQESYGYQKGVAAKISYSFDGGPDPSKFGFAITGSGHAAHLDSIALELRAEVAQQAPLSPSELQEHLQKVLTPFYKKYVLPFSAYPSEERGDFDLLCAYQSAYGLALLQADRNHFSKVERPYTAVGSGAFHAINLLHQMYPPSGLEAAIATAVYVMQQVKNAVEGCGGHTMILVLQRGKRPEILALEYVLELERLFMEYPRVRASQCPACSC